MYVCMYLSIYMQYILYTTNTVLNPPQRQKNLLQELEKLKQEENRLEEENSRIASDLLKYIYFLLIYARSKCIITLDTSARMWVCVCRAAVYTL